MHELTRVTLENEMDLILAHKRSMKLAELAGLSLSAQTTFATAVSEVARNMIDSKRKSYLALAVQNDRRDWYIVASMNDENNETRVKEGLENAKRLVNKYKVSTEGKGTAIELFYYISPSFRIDVLKLDEWRGIFRNEPPVSPYEELKLKNEQLQELSERVQKSETQYKTLTNALPLTILSLDLEGRLLYANDWLQRYTGQTAEVLNETSWQHVIHAEDSAMFTHLLQHASSGNSTPVNVQLRLRNHAGDHLWHQIALSPMMDEKGGLQYWIGFIVDIHAQKVFEETLKDNIELKQTQQRLKENQRMMEQYIEELNRSNQELQQFAFVASHDLQEPVRKLLFYSDYLIGRYSSNIDQKGMEFLTNMQTASQRMRTLIQDLLMFSQINKKQIAFGTVDLNQVAADAQQDLEIAIEEKQAKLHVGKLPTVVADQRMMRQLFENILSNSIKYGREGQAPEIEVSAKENGGFVEIAFRDNGIGFDEKYLPQMFALFQRLHARDEYEGTGLGLAICRKIVEMHHGHIRAESNQGAGATFFVTLPLKAEVAG